jgi:hypothetical protein
LRTGDANLRLYTYKQFKYPVPNVLTSSMASTHTQIYVYKWHNEGAA